jgi:hypothetical protein
MDSLGDLALVLGGRIVDHVPQIVQQAIASITKSKG